MSAIAELIAQYEQAPARLREAVAGLSRDQLLARPVAGKLSTLEVVAHIADFEPILADRMKRILALDKPPIPAVDENLYLAALDYQGRDVEEELRLVEATRTSMARLLRRLPAEAFARTGVHSVRGEVTLARMLEIANYHIPHHLPFIVEKRKALGA